MVRQLTPIVRFDGYHMLADVTGVPDLFQRIKPTLLGLLPWRWGRPENRVLKPWARAVVTVWVLVVVPLLVVLAVLMVLTLPRILGTAWASIGKQMACSGAPGRRRLRGRGARARDRSRSSSRSWPSLDPRASRCASSPTRRVERDKRSTAAARPGRRAGPGSGRRPCLWAGGRGGARTARPAVRGRHPRAGRRCRGPGWRPAGRAATVHVDDAGPTVMRDPPAKAAAGPGTGSPRRLVAPRPGARDGTRYAAQPWVFPFNKPLAPGAGDNQALGGEHRRTTRPLRRRVRAGLGRGRLAP